MADAVESPERKLDVGRKVLLIVLTVAYLLIAPLMLIVWLGIQSIPLDPAMPKEFLPLHALAFLVGGIGGIAILRWKRWGVYALGVSWAVVWGLSLLAFPSVQLLVSMVATVVLAAVILGPLWKHLT